MGLFLALFGCHFGLSRAEESKVPQVKVIPREDRVCQVQLQYDTPVGQFEIMRYCEGKSSEEFTITTPVGTHVTRREHKFCNQFWGGLLVRSGKVFLGNRQNIYRYVPEPDEQLICVWPPNDPRFDRPDILGTCGDYFVVYTQRRPIQLVGFLGYNDNEANNSSGGWGLIRYKGEAATWLKEAHRDEDRGVIELQLVKAPKANAIGTNRTREEILPVTFDLTNEQFVMPRR